IRVDTPGNRLDVLISEEEMNKRREAWKPKDPGDLTGYLARYRELVTSGNTGAVLRIPGSEK
ncbi:MAG: dihydroxy-acid dehydratase, partial [Lachnospiraceae bacterium]|nr:dihydroxy-acid dehydratase [Lachnospiraceae bacterium]